MTATEQLEFLQSEIKTLQERNLELEKQVSELAPPTGIELHQKIATCGIFNYDYKKISVIVDMPENEVKAQMNDKNSAMFKTYNNAKILFQYKYGCAALRNLFDGDLKAMEHIEKIINNE